VTTKISPESLDIAPFLLRLLSQPNEASARRLMGALGIGLTTGQVPEGGGNLYFTNARVLAAIPTLDHGIYTPTLVSVANVAAVTAGQCSWLRVGNTVTVGGSITLDPTTASTLTEIGISLPVASNFTAVDQLGGAVACGNAQSRSGQLLADVANKRAQLLVTPTDVANRTQAFSFSYRVL
jgi:hypothetical protein